MNLIRKKCRMSHAFTIAEMMVVIVVLGILMSIVLLNLNGWRQSTTANQIKSDLNGVATAMEDARNQGNGYPTSLPSTFQPSNGVTVVYKSGNASSYCINASDTPTGQIQYYISTSGGVPIPKAGAC